MFTQIRPSRSTACPKGEHPLRMRRSTELARAEEAKSKHRDFDASIRVQSTIHQNCLQSHETTRTVIVASLMQHLVIARTLVLAWIRGPSTCDEADP